VPEKFELNTTATVAEAKVNSAISDIYINRFSYPIVRVLRVFQVVSYYLTRSNQQTISLDRVGDYDRLVKDKFGHPNLR